ncbi:MAG: hypothetical protein ACK4WD_14295 [Flavobacteriales bacterium]|jgi:hypothetical protein
MKRILAIFAIFAAFTADAQNIITAENISIEINSETTREAIYTLTNDLSAQGINVTFNPQFDNTRKLVAISYRIALSNGTILGEVNQVGLVAPGSKTKFTLAKQDGVFKVTCLDKCN